MRKYNRGILKAILTSLKAGSSIAASCDAAGINVTTFWYWRKKNKRLAKMVEAIQEAHVDVVESALYASALSGDTKAQTFFLKNRSSKRWTDKQEVKVTGDSENPITIKVNEMPTDAIINDVIAKLTENTN